MRGNAQPRAPLRERNYNLNVYAGACTRESCSRGGRGPEKVYAGAWVALRDRNTT